MCLGATDLPLLLWKLLFCVRDLEPVADDGEEEEENKLELELCDEELELFDEELELCEEELELWEEDLAKATCLLEDDCQAMRSPGNTAAERKYRYISESVSIMRSSFVGIESSYCLNNITW